MKNIIIVIGESFIILVIHIYYHFSKVLSSRVYIDSHSTLTSKYSSQSAQFILFGKRYKRNVYFQKQLWKLLLSRIKYPYCSPYIATVHVLKKSYAGRQEGQEESFVGRSLVLRQSFASFHALGALLTKFEILIDTTVVDERR